MNHNYTSGKTCQRQNIHASIAAPTPVVEIANTLTELPTDEFVRLTVLVDLLEASSLDTSPYRDSFITKMMDCQRTADPLEVPFVHFIRSLDSSEEWQFFNAHRATVLKFFFPNGY